MINFLLQQGQGVVRKADLEQISEGGVFSDGQLLISILLGVLIVALLTGYVLWWKHKQRFTTAPIGEEQIFQRLCEVSDLTRSESYLVRKIVFDLSIQNPLDVFVDSLIFDEYAKRLSGNRAALVRNVRNKLFA